MVGDQVVYLSARGNGQFAQRNSKLWSNTYVNPMVLAHTRTPVDHGLKEDA